MSPQRSGLPRKGSHGIPEYVNAVMAIVGVVRQHTGILLGVAVLVLLLLAWAPWMNDLTVHDMVFSARAATDGTIDKETGDLICDYEVRWAPFGRWVASCEGGYFVTFWGAIA